MTLAKLKTILEGTGMPVAYYCWPEKKAPPLPYICYHSPESHNFAADGIVYYSADRVLIELYSRHRDTEAENKITEALTEAGIFWERSEEFLPDEKCFETIYECEV